MSLGSFPSAENHDRRQRTPLPSLRAKRSNPQAVGRILDCFVAFAPRNDGRFASAPAAGRPY
ncbi:MAG: hypothetical protein C3F11_06750 [Methylocystaceae bacterium]|nr:MAG: hypothetical protein C3F11_06750 [Methylocystaceae bacterium]